MHDHIDTKSACKIFHQISINIFEFDSEAVKCTKEK